MIEGIEVHEDISSARGQKKGPLRSAVAQLVKEPIWRYLVQFKPSKQPICLYSSRRSGSTLLMEVICVNSGVMFSDQPFGLFTASSANLNLLPLFPYGQIANPDPEEETLLRRYVEGLLSGRLRANIPWKFWSREFHVSNNRICLKITDAKAIIDWIDSNFDVQTLVSTRHPIAQAISVSNTGWLTTSKGFLYNSRFVDRWLANGLEGYCWDTYWKGSELEKRVLDWALENLPMLSLLPDKKHWLYVSYEDLILNTEAALEYLSSCLGLDNRRAMVARVARPSRSFKHNSTPKKRQLILEGNREQLVNGWRSQIDDQERRACFRVLDRLGMDLYSPDKDMPDHSRLGCQRIG